MPKVTTKELKKLLANEFCGQASDWRRRDKVEGNFFTAHHDGEIRRDFENILTGRQVSIIEHQDGMLSFENAEGKERVARLSTRGRFNERAKYSAVDNVVNDILNGKNTTPWLLERAIDQGLAGKFAFAIYDNTADGGDIEVTFSLAKHRLKKGASDVAETAAVKAMLKDVYTVTADDGASLLFPNMTAADIAVSLTEKGFTLSRTLGDKLPEVRQALAKLKR